MTGSALLSALQVTTTTVKVIRNGRVIGWVPPARARIMVKSGNYAGDVNKSLRVRAIRDLSKPVPVWQKCYRTGGAAMMSPSLEYWMRVSTTRVP